MLVLRLLLLTLCCSQVQTLHDIRNTTIDLILSATKTRFPVFFFLYKSTVYANPGSLRPLLSSGVATRSTTKPASLSLVPTGPTQRPILSTQVTLVGRNDEMVIFASKSMSALPRPQVVRALL